MKIALIGCSKKKKDVTCEASQLYSESVLFYKTYKYCLKESYDKVFILSAKYLLLKPEQIICPYDMTIKSFSPNEKKQWAEQCFEQIKQQNLEQENFDFFTGIDYYKYLSNFLPNSTNFFKGLSIGQRLQFLNNQ